MAEPGRGACASHLSDQAKIEDHDRGSSAKRGYGAQHRAWRKLVLHRHPVCVIQVLCNGALSIVADHIVPLNRGGTFAETNGQGACEDCHNWKRATLDKRAMTLEQILAAQDTARQTKHLQPDAHVADERADADGGRGGEILGGKSPRPAPCLRARGREIQAGGVA